MGLKFLPCLYFCYFCIYSKMFISHLQQFNNDINWSVSVWKNDKNHGILLLMFVFNWLQQLRYREKILLQPLIYIISAAICWSFALYFFLIKLSSWQVNFIEILFHVFCNAYDSFWTVKNPFYCPSRSRFCGLCWTCIVVECLKLEMKGLDVMLSTWPQ